MLKSAWSGCQQVDNCGSGQIAKAFPQKKLLTQLSRRLPLNLGDNVVLGLNESALLSSAWQVYLWPLVGLIAASWLGQWMVKVVVITEIFAITFGCFGGYLGFFFSKTATN